MEDARELDGLDSARYHEIRVINAHGGEITIKIAWDSDVFDWARAFKTILMFLTFGESTINEAIKTEESYEETEEEKERNNNLDESGRYNPQNSIDDRNTCSELFVPPKRSHKKKSRKQKKG